MRLLFADSIADTTVTELESRGHECVLEPTLVADELPGRIAGFDALVVRSTKVDARVIEAGDRLSLVIRAGAGTNTIDIAAAAARGVFVANVPGRNAAAVAELTLGLLLAIDRRIPESVTDLRAGHWDKKGHSHARGLLGSTMGIVGLGNIGLAVAERAVAFGIAVQSLGKSGRPPHIEARASNLGVTMVDSLQELASTSDIVSLHVPSSPETVRLVDEAFLGWMKTGAILLNTSRADVVDEAALLAALDTRGLRAGLDVYADEPATGTAEWTSPIARHPNVVGTHHIGASTQQAQRAIAAGVVEIVDAFADGQAPNVVNLAPSRLGSATLTVRHLDRVGVLSRVLDLLTRARINVEHMQNRVFSGGEAAVATIDIAGQVTDPLLEDIRAIPDVLGVSVAALAPGVA